MPVIALAVLLAASALAQSPPQITIEQRAKFLRAQAETLAAISQAQKAQTALDAVRAELVKTCGDRELTADRDGEPVCQLKPEPKK